MVFWCWLREIQITLPYRPAPGSEQDSSQSVPFFKDWTLFSCKTSVSQTLFHALWSMYDIIMLYVQPKFGDIKEYFSTMKMATKQIHTWMSISFVQLFASISTKKKKRYKQKKLQSSNQQTKSLLQVSPRNISNLHFHLLLFSLQDPPFWNWPFPAQHFLYTCCLSLHYFMNYETTYSLSTNCKNNCYTETSISFLMNYNTEANIVQ